MMSPTTLRPTPRGEAAVERHIHSTHSTPQNTSVRYLRSIRSQGMPTKKGSTKSSAKAGGAKAGGKKSAGTKSSGSKSASAKKGGARKTSATKGQLQKTAVKVLAGAAAGAVRAIIPPLEEVAGTSEQTAGIEPVGSQQQSQPPGNSSGKASRKPAGKSGGASKK